MSNASLKDATKAADSLRAEAKLRLVRLLPGMPYDDVERIVDCIIGAAVLEVAALQSDAIKK